MKLLQRLRCAPAMAPTAMCFLSLTVCAGASAAGGGNVETPSAQSIGTTLGLHAAAQTLLANFAAVAGRAGITLDDLKRVVATRDANIPDGARDAAKFFLVSPVARKLAAVPGEHGPLAMITQGGLQKALELEAGGDLEPVLLKIVLNGGHDEAAEKRNYAILLRDPGVPAPTRTAIVSRLSDVQLMDIVGHPNTQGNARDVSDETGAFLGLARMSWLGTAEAEALAHYRVPFAMDRGSQDHDVSYWNGQAMHLSEKMITGGKPGYVWELLAHEGGHAIFQLSGLKAKTANDVTAGRLAPHIDNIMNEAFAGAFGNRAHVVLFGLGDRGVDRNLQLFNDLAGSVANDKTFYANRYHVDTAAARAQIPAIKQVMAQELVPELQGAFGLLGDPLLTLQLPVQH